MYDIEHLDHQISPFFVNFLIFVHGLPKEQSSCRDDEERDYDQEVGEGKMVVEADMRVGVGGRGVVWLTRAAVIVPIE